MCVLELLNDRVTLDLLPHMMPHSGHWVEAHFEPLLKDKHFMDYNPVLTNGDLACYHLLWNKTEAFLTGVIDFGTAGIGDPASDYACVIYNYGETFLAWMARYEKAIFDAVNRARF
jgi:aminoglycoside 2''-phosphotransferase